MEVCVQYGHLKGVGLPAAPQMCLSGLEKVLQHCLTIQRDSQSMYDYDKECDAVLLAMLQQPAVQRLTADAQVRLLSACIEERLPNTFVIVCSYLPVAAQGVLDQGAVRQLLQAAVETRQWGPFDWLMQLPAAAALADDDEVAMWRAVRGFYSVK
jgi:hypothetical protein